MNAKRLLGALLTVGLTLAAATQATDVQAKPKKEDAAVGRSPRHQEGDHR